MPLTQSDLPGDLGWFETAFLSAQSNNTDLAGWSDHSTNGNNLTPVAGYSEGGGPVAPTYLTNQFKGLPGIYLPAETGPWPGTGESVLGLDTGLTTCKAFFLVIKDAFDGLGKYGTLVSNSAGYNGGFYGGSPEFWLDPNTANVQSGIRVRVNGVDVPAASLLRRDKARLIYVSSPAAMTLDTLGSSNVGSGIGAVYGLWIPLADEPTDPQLATIEQYILDKYIDDPTIDDLVHPIGDSRFWGTGSTEGGPSYGAGGCLAGLIAEGLNGVGSHSRRSDVYIDAQPGDQTHNINDRMTGVSRAAYNPDRPTKHIWFEGTNELFGFDIPITAATAWLNLCNSVQAARALDPVNPHFGCTEIDRSRAGTQITGGQTEINAKRAEFNGYYRANVYPEGHELAGQQVFDHVIDLGAAVLPFDVGTLHAGDPNPLGVDGGSDPDTGVNKDLYHDDGTHLNDTGNTFATAFILHDVSDAVPPVAPTVVVSKPVLSQVAYEVTLSGSDDTTDPSNLTFALALDGNPVSGAEALHASDSPYTLHTDGGTHTLTVTEKDAAGNVSPNTEVQLEQQQLSQDMRSVVTSGDYIQAMTNLSNLATSLKNAGFTDEEVFNLLRDSYGRSVASQYTQYMTRLLVDSQRN